MSRFIFYSILFFLISCVTREKETPNRNLFNVSYTQLKVDTVIRSIAYSSGYYLCLQENLKVAVFDSTFTRNKKIEDAINIFPISSLYTFNDTIFLSKNEPYLLGYPKYQFYCINGFEIQKRKYLVQESTWPVNSWPLLQDSTYNVYANRLGSGGFLVFFFNRLSKKTFITWSNGPIQMLKFNNKFYIAEQGDNQISPAFRMVSDPTILIEVSDKDALNLKQLFQHLSAPPSPIAYYENLADSIRKSSLPYYGIAEKGTYFSIPIVTFIKDKNLYSLIQNDSSIYLTVHKNDSLVNIQSILDSSIGIRRMSHNLINNNPFVTFEASGIKGINGQKQHYGTNGFILIRESLIDIRYYYFHKP
jgi:hypothetical protein